MADFVQIGGPASRPAVTFAPKPRPAVLWLQTITLAWMLVELGVAAYSASTAHSPALLAFASDSLVELLSATVVLCNGFPPSPSRNARRAAHPARSSSRWHSLSPRLPSHRLALRLQPETSCSGIAITVAALIAMPILAAFKRREARRSGNRALAADAVQSATCAYLAPDHPHRPRAELRRFHLAWFDALAALAAIPILVQRRLARAWRGQPMRLAAEARSIVPRRRRRLEVVRQFAGDRPRRHIVRAGERREEVVQRDLVAEVDDRHRGRQRPLVRLLAVQQVVLAEGEVEQVARGDARRGRGRRSRVFGAGSR